MPPPTKPAGHAAECPTSTNPACRSIKSGSLSSAVRTSLVVRSGSPGARRYSIDATGHPSSASASPSGRAWVRSYSGRQNPPCTKTIMRPVLLGVPDIDHLVLVVAVPEQVVRVTGRTGQDGAVLGHVRPPGSGAQETQGVLRQQLGLLIVREPVGPPDNLPDGPFTERIRVVTADHHLVLAEGIHQ